jgi:hypothetical protein
VRNFAHSTQYYYQVPEAPVLPSMQFIFPSSTSMGGLRFCYRRNPSYDNFRPNGEIVLEQNLTVSDSELLRPFVTNYWTGVLKVNA